MEPDPVTEAIDRLHDGLAGLDCLVSLVAASGPQLEVPASGMAELLRLLRGEVAGAAAILSRMRTAA